MNFKTNFSELTLILNQPTIIHFENKVVEINVPSITYYLFDIDFQEWFYLLKMSVEDFNETFKSINIKMESRYGIFKMVHLMYKDKRYLFEKYTKLILPNCVLEEGQITFNEIKLTEEEYEIIFDILLAGCGEKTVKEVDNIINQKSFSSSEKSVLSKQKELEDKIKAIKDKNKKDAANKSGKKEQPKGSTITIDQIVIAILYEFSSLTIEDINKMNMFTLLHFWSYVAKVVDTQIQVVAAGNGLAKEFTYFIN